MDEILYFLLGLLTFVGVRAIWVWIMQQMGRYDSLDEATELLARKEQELSTANAELQKRNNELYETGKTLVRRDLELSRSNERLLELDETKSRFVATAAHQLRTPLTGIRWSLAEVLEGDFGELQPELKKVLQEASTTTDRLITLVNDLLDMAHLNEGRDTFVLEPTDLLPLLRAGIEQYRTIADQKGVTLTTELPESLPVVEADADKLTMVLDNLLDNAIKYTPMGGTVAVTAATDTSKVAVHVSDTGIGVPEDQTSQLFSRFFRAHNATLMETSGTGLGLAMVKKIMDKHNGTVEHAHGDGGGSVFTFTLPMYDEQ